YAYLHFKSATDAARFYHANQGDQVIGFLHVRFVPAAHANGQSVHYELPTGSQPALPTPSVSPVSESPEAPRPSTHCSSSSSERNHANDENQEDGSGEEEDDSVILKRLHGNVATSLKRLANDFAQLEQFYAKKRQKIISLSKQFE
ncbi:hypothetical protein EC973_006931, partial [Apophysomyces ossiformis]